MMRHISLQKTQFKVSDFISWQKNGVLTLSPAFQRRPGWPAGAKSFFVDTVIRGLPIPIVFLRERRISLAKLEASREVVDGQQRLRTLIAFIDSKLLPDKRESDEFVISRSHNDEFGGMSFKELPDEIKSRILDYEISVHVLPSSVGDREVLEIFSRMNATGMKLNNQELRNAEFFGELKSAVYATALKHLDRWKSWSIFSDQNIARMEEVELTSELFYMIINGISAKSQKTLHQFYKDNDAEFKSGAMVQKRFNHLMDTIDDLLGDRISDLEFHKKSLFYPFFSALYLYCYGDAPLSTRKKPKPLMARHRVKLERASSQLANGTAPKHVVAGTHSTSHKKTRADLAIWIVKRLSSG